MVENQISEMISTLRDAADQLAVALGQLQSGRNDGWVNEYYRETVNRLQEDLCIQLRKIPTGDREQQLDMFGTESS